MRRQRRADYKNRIWPRSTKAICQEIEKLARASYKHLDAEQCVALFTLGDIARDLRLAIGCTQRRPIKLEFVKRHLERAVRHIELFSSVLKMPPTEPDEPTPEPITHH